MLRPSRFAFFLLFLFLSPLFAEQAEEQFQKSYPIPGTGSISLSNVNGNVTITGWTQDTVEVHAIKKANSEKDLKYFWIEVHTEENTIEIETKFSEDHHFRRIPGSVDYEIRVPQMAELKAIHLVTGNLMITGLNGSVSASCVDGELHAHGIRGPLKLSTVNGSLEVEFDQLLEGRIQISSVSGRISVSVPKDSDAAFLVSTLSGSIRNDFGFEEEGERFIGRKLRGTLGRGTAQVELSNVSGSIVIRRA